MEKVAETFLPHIFWPAANAILHNPVSSKANIRRQRDRRELLTSVRRDIKSVSQLIASPLLVLALPHFLTFSNVFTVRIGNLAKIRPPIST
jgi:hypothetical protein